MYNHLWVYNCTDQCCYYASMRNTVCIVWKYSFPKLWNLLRVSSPLVAEAATLGLVLSVHTTASTLFSHTSIPESQLASISPLKAHCMPIGMPAMQTRPNAGGDVEWQECSFWWDGGNAQRTAVWKSSAVSYETKHPLGTLPAIAHIGVYQIGWKHIHQPIQEDCWFEGTLGTEQ